MEHQYNKTPIFKVLERMNKILEISNKYHIDELSKTMCKFVSIVNADETNVTYVIGSIDSENNTKYMFSNSTWDNILGLTDAELEYEFATKTATNLEFYINTQFKKSDDKEKLVNTLDCIKSRILDLSDIIKNDIEKANYELSKKPEFMVSLTDEEKNKIHHDVQREIMDQCFGVENPKYTTVAEMDDAVEYRYRSECEKARLKKHNLFIEDIISNGKNIGLDIFPRNAQLLIVDHAVKKAYEYYNDISTKTVTKIIADRLELLSKFFK